MNRWRIGSTVHTHAEYDVSLTGFTVVCLSTNRGMGFSLLQVICLAPPVKCVGRIQHMSYYTDHSFILANVCFAEKTCQPHKVFQYTHINEL